MAANDDFEDKAAPLITHQADSRISLTLPATGSYYLHLGDTQHKGGPEYAYRLRVGAPRPDFALRVVPSSINARAGTAAPITVHALRRDGFGGAITLELEDAPPGLSLNGGRVPAGIDQVRLTLTVPPAPCEKPLGLSLVGRAAVQGREVRRPAIPAEDMIQAFAYHHLVPAGRLLLTVTPRRLANYWWKLTDERPVKLPAGGTARAGFAVPGGPLVEQAKLELSEPPEGVTIQSVTPSRAGVSIVLHADARKVKPGLKGNLIVNAVSERAINSAEGKPTGKTYRSQLGMLPALPFEVVGKQPPRPHAAGHAPVDAVAGPEAQDFRLLPHARLVGGGEVGGNLLRHLARGGPFHAALEGDDEGHALELFDRMAEALLKHPALAVLDGEQHRLVLAGAPLVLGREGRGQHGEVLRRAAEPAVQLVGHVHEDRRQALR